MYCTLRNTGLEYSEFLLNISGMKHESHWIDALLYLREPQVETFQSQHVLLLVHLWPLVPGVGSTISSQKFGHRDK